MAALGSSLALATLALLSHGEQAALALRSSCAPASVLMLAHIERIHQYPAQEQAEL